MCENKVIKKLFESVIPERLEEVMILANEDYTQFRLSNDKTGFNLEGGPFGLVKFTNRSMEQLWLFGHAGWLSLYCYPPSLWGLNLEELQKTSGQKEANEKFAQLINNIRNLADVADDETFSWPSGCPKPEEGRPPDKEQSLVYDLTCMAAAYLFLHELKHVIFQKENNAPVNPLEEEYACDSFAHNMMMSKIKVFSTQSGNPEDKLKTKRAMGIALASAFLLFATSKENINGTDKHPPIQKRWLNTANAVDLPANDDFWLYFSSIILAMFQYLKIPFLPKKFSDFKELCHMLIESLDQYEPDGSQMGNESDQFR